MNSAPRQSIAFRVARGWPTRLALVALLLIASTGCDFLKSPQQQAQEALDAGLQAHLAGSIPEATAQYQECLEQEPTNKYCLFNLGVIAQAEARGAEAENFYRMAIAEDATFASPMFNLAILRTAAGAPEEAMELYRNVIEVAPDNAGAHLNLGLLLINSGDERGGQEEIVAALAIDPSIYVPQSTTAPSESPAPS